jgi:hypothetical protein
MEKNPSWEANRFSANQEVPRIFLEPEGSLPRLQVSDTCPYPDLTFCIIPLWQIVTFCLVWLLLPTHGRRRGLLLHLITLCDTHTHTHIYIYIYIYIYIFSRTHLDEGSDRRKVLYLYNTQHSQRDSTAPGGIRTGNPSKRATADLQFNPRGHRDRQTVA